MKADIIKKIYESSGSNDQLRTEVFTKKIMDMMEGENPKITPDDISIKGLHEAVSSYAFPIIMGTVLGKVVIAAYNARAGLVKELTTLYKSNLADENIPGSVLKSNMKKVKELEKYPHTGDIQEKYVTASHEKYGEILDISEEALKFDRTGLIMLTARSYGKAAAELQEQIVLNTIQDIAGYYAWYPAGSRTAMYSTSTTAPHFNSNQITNALADFTDLDAAKVLFGGMVDEDGKPIVVIPKILLVPVALDTTAKRLVGNSVMVGAANAEKNPFQNEYVVRCSPYLDAQSTIIWYLGDFKQQFIWKEITPLQVLTRKKGDNDGNWNQDIEASFKIRFDGQCRALDFTHVIKSTGAA